MKHVCRLGPKIKNFRNRLKLNIGFTRAARSAIVTIGPRPRSVSRSDSGRGIARAQLDGSRPLVATGRRGPNPHTVCEACEYEIEKNEIEEADVTIARSRSELTVAAAEWTGETRISFLSIYLCPSLPSLPFFSHS